MLIEFSHFVMFCQLSSEISFTFYFLILFLVASRSRLIDKIWQQSLPRFSNRWKLGASIGLFGLSGSLSAALFSTSWTIKEIARMDTPLGKQARSLTKPFQDSESDENSSTTTTTPPNSNNKN
jgi:hypothetical protein